MCGDGSKCGCECGGGGVSGSNLKDQVSTAIDKIRPMLQADGGDVELVDVDDQGVVSVRLQGSCAGCPMSQITLKNGIEKHLKEHVPAVKEVVSVP